MSREPPWTPTLLPLTRDYWPAGTRLPYLRLALALAGAPLAVGLALALLTYAAYALVGDASDDPLGPGGRDPLAQATRMAIAFYTAFTPLTLLAGGPMVALLWSLRLRSAGAWLLAGLLTGGAAAAVQAISSGAPMIGEATPLVLIGAPLLLTLRWIAGVRA